MPFIPVLPYPVLSSLLFPSRFLFPFPFPLLFFLPLYVDSLLISLFPFPSLFSPLLPFPFFPHPFLPSSYPSPPPPDFIFQTTWPFLPSPFPPQSPSLSSLFLHLSKLSSSLNITLLCFKLIHILSQFNLYSSFQSPELANFTFLKPVHILFICNLLLIFFYNYCFFLSRLVSTTFSPSSPPLITILPPFSHSISPSFSPATLLSQPLFLSPSHPSLVYNAL